MAQFLRSDFRPESDIDIVVDFRPGPVHSLLHLAGMEAELEEVFGRPVDLITRQTIEESRNHIRKKQSFPQWCRYMSRDDAYLLDLLLMDKDVSEFTNCHTRESLVEERLCQYAVIRCLEMRGEVSKRPSQETMQRFSSIEWSAMARMRDMLIHSYGTVDLNEIWDTVNLDIPRLIAAIELFFTETD